MASKSEPNGGKGWKLNFERVRRGLENLNLFLIKFKLRLKQNLSLNHYFTVHNCLKFLSMYLWIQKPTQLSPPVTNFNLLTIRTLLHPRLSIFHSIEWFFWPSYHDGHLLHASYASWTGKKVFDSIKRARQ